MAYRIVTGLLRIGIGLEKYILIIFTHAWLSLAAAAYQSQAVSQQHKERNEKAAQHKKTKLNSEAFLLHLLSFREKASFFLLPN